MKVKKARRLLAAQIGGEQRAVFLEALGIVADHQRVGRNARGGDVAHVDVRRPSTSNSRCLESAPERYRRDAILGEVAVERHVVGGPTTT